MAAMALGAAAVLLMRGAEEPAAPRYVDAEVSSQARQSARYAPTAAQWDSLCIVPVERIAFRSETVTEGRISINEDQATPVFPPYAGRVTRLVAKPGAKV